MRKLLNFFSLLLVMLIVSCSQPPQVVSLKPSSVELNVYKIVEGKKSKQSVGLKSALILPKGTIPTFTSKSNFGSNSLLLSSLGYATSAKISYEKDKLPEDFKRNLAKSIEAIMLNKGYKVTGPYKSIDEMTYKEKRSVDFVLIPILELYPEIKDNGCKNSRPVSVSALAPAVKKGEIYCSGKVSFKGQLSFELREPLTKEKIYIKGIDFNTNSENFEVKVIYERPEDTIQAYSLANKAKMEAINNALNKALHLAYKKFIDMFAKYMPEDKEAKELKQQIEELKKLKRY